MSMARYVFTIKIGSISDDRGLLRDAAIIFRDAESGRVGIGSFRGTREEVIKFFDDLESIPDVKVKYE